MNFSRYINSLILAPLLTLTLGACGGGGGGSNSAPPATGGTPPPSTPEPTPEPTAEELTSAAKLLSMATFGPTLEQIDSVARQGTEAWLTEQFSLSYPPHLPIVRRYAIEYGADPAMEPSPGIYRRFAFWEQAIQAPDQLRQLTAYAMTQIFVVSDNVDAIFIDPQALSSYYDMLGRNAFGNFRDLLTEVTLHPVMGFYLSHLNNGKSDPVANTFPDENYAREVMQLFSIGLFELNADGTEVLDTQGQPIATYDNGDIREFSKIFTGLSYGSDGGPSFFGNNNPVMHIPMTMFDEFHESGPKTLLNGTVVPTGQTGMQDIDAAIENLFNHPNIGPFIGRQLIQRLVTSNPSPAYVARVSAAFNGDTSGVRGDMQAVIRAILLDPEAETGTRLREPFRRYLALNRGLNLSSDDGTLPVAGYIGQFLTQQNVLSAPSVFNFYLPDFSPSGALGDAGLTAPEFQITNASTIIGISNLVAYALYTEDSIDTLENFTPTRPDLSPFADLADDPAAFADQTNLLFYAGDMDATTRSALEVLVRDGRTAGLNPLDTARAGLFFALSAPGYAIAGGNS